jgi:hypothetical protein
MSPTPPVTFAPNGIPVSSPPAGPMPGVMSSDAPMCDGAGLVEDPYAAAPRFFVKGEYLGWWTRNDRVPPLVTTSAPGNLLGNINTAADLGDQGVIGGRTTQVLFSGPLDYGMQSGMRITAGWYFGCSKDIALEGSYFFLGRGTSSFTANSSQFPVLARPFLNLNTQPVPTEDAEVVSYPSISTGSIRVDSSSQLSGAELNMRFRLGCDCCCPCPAACDPCNACNPCCNACCPPTVRWDLLIGARYLRLHESLRITEDFTISSDPRVAALLNGAFAPGDHVIITDGFTTHNEFYGGQVGIAGEWKYGRWSVDWRGKLAVGTTHQTLDIDGSQTIIRGGTALPPFNGGLLALSSNIGHYTRDRFSVAPEIGLDVGYQLTPAIRIFAGYNFLAWTHVLRPGEQIDRGLDVTLIPNGPPGTPTGLNRPAVPFRDSTYWAQGITAGLEFRW